MDFKESDLPGIGKKFTVKTSYDQTLRIILHLTGKREIFIYGNEDDEDAIYDLELGDEDANLMPIDFGCIKKVPNEFYIPYFELANPKVINNPILFEEKLYELEILRTDDSPEEIKYFTGIFYRLLSLFTQPFHGDYFDFSDDAFFGAIATMGEEFTKDTQLRKMNGNRGSKHFLYINRTFFGLYNLMHDLKAAVHTQNYIKYI